MTSPATTPPPPTKQRRLNKSEQAEACELWALGDVTAADLGSKFSISEDALYKLFKRRGIIKGQKRAEIERKKQAALDTALTIDATVHARRVFDTKNETYRILEMLRKLVAAEVVKARQAGNPLGTIANDMKAIREAAAAIKICREEAYAVLGITTEQAGNDNLPTLDIRGLTDNEIDELQKANVDGGLDAIAAQDPLGPEGQEEVE